MYTKLDYVKLDVNKTCITKIFVRVILHNRIMFLGKLFLVECQEIRETSRRENFTTGISGNPGNFPSGKFHHGNFGKSGKLPVGKISPGEFREIRETSRRENFVGCFIAYYTIFFARNAL
jgi:hypothetical protein